MVGVRSPEGTLQSVVIEGSDRTYDRIERLLGRTDVPIIGRLATASQVGRELSTYTSDGRKLFNRATVFFVGGILSPSGNNGDRGDEIIRELAAANVAYPARLVAHDRRTCPPQLPGIAFRCLNGLQDRRGENDNYTLNLAAPDAAGQLGHMLAIAADVLPEPEPPCEPTVRYFSWADLLPADLR